MPQLLRIASIAVWTIATLVALAWLVLVGIDFFSGACHGVQACFAKASLLNNAFWLFFVLGILIDGTERLIRWWGRRRQ